VVELLARGEPKRAHEAALALPDGLVQHAGTEARLLRAIAAYRAGELSSVITELESLLREQPAFPSEHPDALFYLARAHDAVQHFGKAVAWGKRWAARPPAAGPQPVE
jgi:hypothetical protein